MHMRYKSTFRLTLRRHPCLPTSGALLHLHNLWAKVQTRAKRCKHAPRGMGKAIQHGNRHSACACKYMRADMHTTRVHAPYSACPFERSREASEHHAQHDEVDKRGEDDLWAAC